MTKVRYSAKARADMLDIWLWIAERGGERLADDILDRMELRVARLSLYPRLGRKRPDIAEGARVLVVERWLVLYDADESDVRIFRVIDGASDLRRLRWEK
jgi:toxin ParE1/3/4